MAEIEFYEEGPEDSLDLGEEPSGDNIEEYDSDPCDPDAGLTPIQKLEKYMDSENMYSRQMVARSLLETLRLVEESDEEVEKVLKCMSRLAEDAGESYYSYIEANVRTELMEQVPHIAMFCHENQRPSTYDPIPTYILPIVVKYLTDSNNQVRKTSQAALLVLLEQELIQKEDVEQQVCPVILELSRPESIDDFRTEAVALMSKLAPLVGKDITVRQFLPWFADLCTDALFHVRKVCAANFGDMCSVVGQENTEKHLLPKFYHLCEDGVWGVRKACAECFMQVSCSCSLEVRRKELAQLFISLVCDQSRWVRMAAFQALGAFISTFADPRVTGLYFNEEGLLVAGKAQEFEQLCENGLNILSDCPDKSCSDSTEVPSACDNASQSNAAVEISGNRSNKLSNRVESNEDSPSSSNAGEVSMELDCDIESENSNEFDSSSPEMSMEEKRAEFLAKKASHADNSNNENSSIISADISNNNQTGSDRNSNNNQDKSSHGAVTNIINPTVNEAGSESGLASQPEEPAEQAPQDSPDVCDEQLETENAEEEFSTFHFWREPLPDIDLDRFETTTVLFAPGDNNQPSSNVHQLPVNMEDKLKELDDVMAEVELTIANADCSSSALHTAHVAEEESTEEVVTNIGSTHVVSHQVSTPTMKIVDGVVQAESSGGNIGFCPAEEGSPHAPANTSEEVTSGDETASQPDRKGDTDVVNDFASFQDVIPQALLDHYLSMTDPSRAQTVDTEIAKHCAYSLPAVAYTLGRKHWPCLKELYDTLAADMQWKVRRTLAFSIHELAIIVGEDITSRDLVPVFNGFLKDLDEVRIGVLKHLADFLRLLLPDIRSDYLGKMAEFLNTDNNRNWRFREELAEQLILLLDLFAPKDIHEHLTPIAFTLVEDKVSEVRLTSFKVLARMLRRLAGDNKLLSVFVNEIKQRLSLSNKWSKRQMYAQLCYCVLYDNSISCDRFATEFLPNLLKLRSDPIPNVRISLARTLSQHMVYSEYFTSNQNPHHEELLQTIHSLKGDKDRDVRYFINLEPITNLGEDDSIDTIPV